jgi:hypothetical protein
MRERGPGRRGATAARDSDSRSGGGAPPPGGVRGAIPRLEAAGALAMVLAGSALHFAYGWSGAWRPLALVAAVNESIWEHLKLAFWPGLAWALVERAALPGLGGQLWAAKGVSLLAISGLIVGVFTGYTAILGRNLLVLDIGTFVLAVALGQALSAVLLARRWPRWARRAGTALLLAQVAAFSLFTFHPPAHWLFLEARSGTYGIPAR